MCKEKLKTLEEKTNTNYNSLRSLRPDAQSNLIVPHFVQCTRKLVIVPECTFRGEIYQNGTIVPLLAILVYPLTKSKVV